VIEVVIAGAGPNGLMLACELGSAGIRPMVLDPMSGANPNPRVNRIVGQWGFGFLITEVCTARSPGRQSRQRPLRAQCSRALLSISHRCPAPNCSWSRFNSGAAAARGGPRLGHAGGTCQIFGPGHCFDGAKGRGGGKVSALRVSELGTGGSAGRLPMGGLTYFGWSRITLSNGSMPVAVNSGTGCR